MDPIIVEFLSTIEKYGLSLFFLVVILVWLKPKIDYVWFRFIGVEKQDDNTARDVKTVLETNSKINEILLEAIQDFQSESATLWQYHNGGMGLSGMPFLKISATHQKVPSGGQIWANTYQNLPISIILHPAFLEDQDVYRLSLTTSDPFGITGLMNTISSKTIYICPIYSSQNLAVACLMISFIPDTTLTEADLRSLERYGHRIGALLEVYNYAAQGVKHGKEK